VTPADALLHALAAVQRTRYGGDWPEGCERDLWLEAEAGQTEDGRRLHELAIAANCWFCWSEESGRMLRVRLPSWQRWMRIGWAA
jgi:hypothetical protein